LGSGDDLPALVMRANVGALALRVGRLADAERDLKHGFESQRALAGDSASVAASMAQYGSLKTALGRPNEALPILEDAERMAVKFTAPASALHVQNRIFLAEAHFAAGHEQRAVDLSTETLAMVRKQFGPDHLYAQRAQLTKTKLLAARQPPEQSLAEIMAVTAKLRGQGPAAQLLLAQALVAHGDLLIKQQRATEALPILEEAVRLREQMMWAKGWELAEARARLGEAQLAAGKQEGKKLLEQSATTLHEQLGPDHPQTLRARKAIAM
jgi:tetratricopeptide (TPR) repeat protein